MNSAISMKMLHSVFTRLLLVILATGLLINLVVFAFFRHYIRNVSTPEYGRNYIEYARLLARDLGSPPSLDRAEETADRLGLAITYRGPAGNWSTDSSGNGPGETSWAEAERIYGEKGAWIEGRHRRHRVVLRMPDGGVVTVSNRHLEAGAEDYLRHLLLLLGVLSLLLVAGYGVLRRIFSPIRALSEGVQAVSAGNLDHRVIPRGRGEFAELADSFNVMTRRVRDMIRAREQMLLDVSHELRTPITRMKVAAEFLAPGRTRESLLEDIAELEFMVTEILETERLRFAGAGSLQPESIDLGDLARSAAAPFVHSPPGMDMDGAASGVIVTGDRARLGTVFRNLYSNAQKFSKKSNAPVRVVVERREHTAVVEIIDRGEGIAEAEIARIFEPFYRVDKSRTRGTGGFGLGLSLCKTIMDAHGGKIEVESRIGQGTTVRLGLPLPSPVHGFRRGPLPVK